MSLLAANLIICESALTEKSGVGQRNSHFERSDSLGKDVRFARFSVLTLLSSAPGDTFPHKLRVQLMSSAGSVIAQAPEHAFIYGYNVDPLGPGAFTLTTQFNLDVAPLGELGAYTVKAYLDDHEVVKSPLIMRRA